MVACLLLEYKAGSIGRLVSSMRQVSEQATCHLGRVWEVMSPQQDHLSRAG